MIYLWHLFTKWSLTYPNSALICDIVIGLLFIIYIMYIGWSETIKEEEEDQ